MNWIMSDFPIENDEGGMSTIRSFSCSNCHYVVPAIHSKCPGCGEEADKGSEFVVAWGRYLDITMTYGDKIRRMDDDQLACLLDSVQFDGSYMTHTSSLGLGYFGCFDVKDWLELIQREVPDGAPRYGIM